MLSIEDGGFYSVPSDDDLAWEPDLALAKPTDVLDGADLQALGTAETVERQHRGLFSFRVLDKRPLQKKLLRETKLAIRAGGAVPWQVQKYGHWQASRAPGRLEVFEDRDSGPEIVNATSIAPWPCLRYALRKWSDGGRADLEGCELMLGGEVVSWPADTDVAKLPIAILLELLAAFGWRAGRLADRPHTDVVEKRLCLDDGWASRPSYLRCLLRLGPLMIEGLSQLHCKQLESYYSAALVLQDKSVLAPNLPNKKYLQWISETAEGKLLSLVDEPPAKRARGALPIAPPLVMTVSVNAWTAVVALTRRLVPGVACVCE